MTPEQKRFIKPRPKRDLGLSTEASFSSGRNKRMTQDQHRTAPPLVKSREPRSISELYHLLLEKHVRGKEGEA